MHIFGKLTSPYTIGVQDFGQAKNYKPTWTKTSRRLVFFLRWKKKIIFRMSLSLFFVKVAFDFSMFEILGIDTEKKQRLCARLHTRSSEHFLGCVQSYTSQVL